MPIYRERVIRTYQVIKLTKHMLQSASNLPGFLSEFHSLGLYTEADCIVYYGKKNTVIRANHGTKIYPKVGDYLGVNSDNELRYWSKDDFLDFYEEVK